MPRNNGGEGGIRAFLLDFFNDTRGTMRHQEYDLYGNLVITASG